MQIKKQIISLCLLTTLVGHAAFAQTTSDIKNPKYNKGVNLTITFGIGVFTTGALTKVFNDTEVDLGKVGWSLMIGGGAMMAVATHDAETGTHAVPAGLVLKNMERDCRIYTTHPDLAPSDALIGAAESMDMFASFTRKQKLDETCALLKRIVVASVYRHSVEKIYLSKEEIYDIASPTAYRKMTDHDFGAVTLLASFADLNYR